MGGEKVSVAWCQLIGMLQVFGWRGSQYSWTEMLCNRRNSNLFDRKTQENTHTRKVGERKEVLD